MIDGYNVEKYITTGEMLVGRVYGCQCVITNVSSAPQQYEVLTQIPGGSIAVEDGLALRSWQKRVEPYRTEKIELKFYFPRVGEFDHYPVQVAARGSLVAHGAPSRIRVVEQLTVIDTRSWLHVSQEGTEDDVITYLESANLARTDIDKCLWRARESEDFWRRLIALLRRRMHYHVATWEFALKYKDIEATVELLQGLDLPQASKFKNIVKQVGIRVM